MKINIFMCKKNLILIKIKQNLIFLKNDLKHRYNITEQIVEQCLKKCVLYKKENVEKEWHTRGKKKRLYNRRVRKTLVFLCLNSITTQDASIQIPKKEKGDTRTCKERPDLFGCENAAKNGWQTTSLKSFVPR